MNPSYPVSKWDQRWINLLLIAAVLFSVLPPGFNWREADDNAAIVEGSLEVKLQWGSLFALSAYVVYRHLAQAMADLRVMNPFLLVMFLYAAAGILWSPADSVTVKKVVQFGGLLLFCLAVQADGRPWTHSVKMILTALIGIEIASVIAALAFPSLGIDAYFGYAWRGVLSTKNTLGGTAAMTLLLLLALWNVGDLSPGTKWFYAILSILCVLMSTSSTAITVMALGFFIFWLLQRQHIGSNLWLLRLLIAVGILLLVLSHLFFIAEGRLPDRSEILGPFASLFGKGADLTGRSDIWEPLMIEIQKHWLFGIGYGSFWLGPGSASQPILDRLPWVPYQGHNGYLDIWNELGLIGLVCFVGLLILVIRQLFEMMKFDRTGAALFGSIYVTLLVSNLTESSIFRGVTFQFWQFLLVCVSLSTALRRQRVLESTPQTPIRSNPLSVRRTPRPA